MALTAVPGKRASRGERESWAVSGRFSGMYSQFAIPPPVPRIAESQKQCPRVTWLLWNSPLFAARQWEVEASAQCSAVGVEIDFAGDCQQENGNPFGSCLAPKRLHPLACLIKLPQHLLHQMWEAGVVRDCPGWGPSPRGNRPRCRTPAARRWP